MNNKDSWYLRIQECATSQCQKIAQNVLINLFANYFLTTIQQKVKRFGWLISPPRLPLFFTIFWTDRIQAYSQVYQACVMHVHSGPTEKKLCAVLSIWRTLQSANNFCGLFGSLVSNLHLRLIFCNYEMLTMVRCHLSVILFTQFSQFIPEIVWAKSTVLTIPKYQQRTVLFINKRKYRSYEHGTNNLGNGASKHLRLFCMPHFLCDF